MPTSRPPAVVAVLRGDEGTGTEEVQDLRVVGVGGVQAEEQVRHRLCGAGAEGVVQVGPRQPVAVGVAGAAPEHHHLAEVDFAGSTVAVQTRSLTAPTSKLPEATASMVASCEPEKPGCP